MRINGLKALLRVIYVKHSHVLGALCELPVQISRLNDSYKLLA